MSGHRVAQLAAISISVLAATASAQDAEPERRHVGEGLFSGWKTVHLAEGGFVGLEPHLFQLDREPASPETDGGLVLSGSMQIFMRSWYPGDDKSVRARLDFELGADTTGFAGGIRHDAAAGFRFPLGADEPPPSIVRDSPLVQDEPELRDSLARVFTPSPHAVVARIGYHLAARGNQAFYESAIEPRVELGYALDGAASLELRGELGWIGTGALHAGPIERDIDTTFTGGGAFILHGGNHGPEQSEDAAVHVELEARRLFADRGDVDKAAIRACLRVGGSPFNALCATADVWTDEIAGPRPGAEPFTATRLGWLASFSWMDP